MEQRDEDWPVLAREGWRKGLYHSMIGWEVSAVKISTFPQDGAGSKGLGRLIAAGLGGTGPALEAEGRGDGVVNRLALPARSLGGRVEKQREWRSPLSLSPPALTKGRSQNQSPSLFHFIAHCSTTPCPEGLSPLCSHLASAPGACLFLLNLFSRLALAGA